MPRFRKTILNGRILISIAAFLAMVSPHIYWMLTHQQAVASQAYKFAMVQARRPRRISLGAFKCSTADRWSRWHSVADFFAVPGDALEKRRARKDNEFVAAHALLLDWFNPRVRGDVHVCGHLCATRGCNRCFFPLPIVLVGLVVPQLRPRSIQILFGLGAATAVTVLVAINGTALAANPASRAQSEHPLPCTRPGIAKRPGFQNGTIIANGFLLGGNLKNQFPASRVVVQESESASAPQRPILIAWPMRSEDLPEDFLNFAGKVTGIGRDQLHPSYIEVPCETAGGDRKKLDSSC